MCICYLKEFKKHESIFFELFLFLVQATSGAGNKRSRQQALFDLPK
jgi:hypothetical protein